MRMGGIVRAAVWTLLCGCAAIEQPSSQTAGEALYRGDPVAEPSMEALPGFAGGTEALTREMRMARMLSAESLNLADPQKPADYSARTIEAWSEGELKSWLAQKHKRAEAARLELDRAAVQNHPQRIMAGAMVGLVYEDVARVLLATPAPHEIDSEPEVAAVYRRVLEGQALPYLVQSKGAYDACVGNAAQLASMEHWSEFCSRRSGHLPRVASEDETAPQ